MSIKTYKPNDTARIKAMLFTSETADTAFAWAKQDIRQKDHSSWDNWEVKTLEGWVSLPFGSYLIEGTNEEFYPCDPDVFEKRWVEVI